jgi:hypothetical protein
MPTGERNDFGECFFGRVRLVSAARIRLPRKNPGEDVCRSQSSLTFSETTGKSYARPASALVIDIAQLCTSLYGTALGLVTVRTPYDSKSKQLGGSSSTLIARILLRELAAEGKA